MWDQCGSGPTRLLRFDPGGEIEKVPTASTVAG